jgi:hypothetical protein
MLVDMGRSRADIDRFCCHPGGVKVIDAIESALELPVGTLDLSATCPRLRQYERADRDVRARTPDRPRLAGSCADDRLRPAFTCAGSCWGAHELAAVAILAFVTLQRRSSRRSHEPTLRGCFGSSGYEVGSGHYPLIVALRQLAGHALLRARPTNILAPPSPVRGHRISRIWVLERLALAGPHGSLSCRRAIGSSGPYCCRSPQLYCGDRRDRGAPVFGLWQIALIFSALNLGILAVRSALKPLGR